MRCGTAKAPAGEFLNDNCGEQVNDNCEDITGTKTTILGLNAGKPHQVQVLTEIAGGGKSVWSDIGTGNTNQANKEPRFDDRPSSGDGSMRGTPHTISRDVDENTQSGRPVGSAIRAEDGDGDRRTYELDRSGSDADRFDIDESSGQVRTKAPLITRTRGAATTIRMIQLHAPTR